jgi:hypothetical protein
VAENRLAPRGEDVWIGLDNGDANGIVLARDLMAAVSTEGGDRAAGMVSGTTDEAPDPATVHVEHARVVDQLKRPVPRRLIASARSSPRLACGGRT